MIPTANVKIKICGMRREEDIQFVNETLPDYVGFIFDKTRKRYVSPEVAQNLSSKLDKRISAVGVFVDASIEEVTSLSRMGIFNTIQLHGSESDDYIQELREVLRSEAPAVKTIIKAFSVTDSEVLLHASKSKADIVLLDNGVGGTGEGFDSSLIPAEGIGRPFILAGGLTPDNVKEAVATLKPYGVDVSSGVEESGVKSSEKIRLFAKKVREN